MLSERLPGCCRNRCPGQAGIRIGVEGLARINAIFAADKPLWKLAPAKRHALRQQYVRPLVDSFFAWAKATSAVTTERGLVATALGYAVRQEVPLRRFLEDGRLRLDNNASERALRRIAVGRKNWLFCGSDDHASAAANLFSLLASCKLHMLDPEAYLADVIRVMPYWPPALSRSSFSTSFIEEPSRRDVGFRRMFRSRRHG
ncbi:MAG: hypothetical protein RL033_6019, partial [Pseudomonadota bacterium]